MLGIRVRVGLVVVLAVAAAQWLAASVPVPWHPFFASPATVADLGANARSFGVATGDFDGDGFVDLVVGRVTGNVVFAKGNGNGTFQTAQAYAWKQAFFNAWAFAAADINGDNHLDVVWGANASSPSAAPFAVNDGEVRVFYGNGDGTFVENPYFVSGVLHNAGSLLADVGTDAGSLAAADVDADGDADVTVGALDGSNTSIKLLRNLGGGVFSTETVLTQPATSALSSPVYFPAISTQNSPWGLALADADGDGDADLWVGDRALYVYLFLNDGHGVFSLREPNTAVPGRPNVYLGHDTARAAVGFTPSLGAGDVNGDGRADLLLGLQSGAQTPASGTANDGVLLLDASAGSAHGGVGPIADIGTMARGVTVADVNGDAYPDVIGANYEGQVVLLRQLPPIDDDGDGVSDYTDNALGLANAPRIDMNDDGAVTHRDQLDNDFDTVLGDPENPSTWNRLGDPADSDDDNDGVDDAADNCPFVSNADQLNADGDAFGAACDPVDSPDADSDGFPDGPLAGDAAYARARDAKIKWSSGTTRFVIRIDALGRFFQNEFTQLMTDAATLSPEDWAVKCWENYEPGDIPGYQPCGTIDPLTGEQTLTLAGGKQVPISLFTIPKQLWTDPPVVAWINDRNDSPLFELAQHGTYHANNTTLGDWNALPDRSFFSCETCGLTEAETFELMKVGFDTLLGLYDNPWIAQSGAAPGSPKIDWSSSRHPLQSFAPPFNTSDTTARKAIAQLGHRAFSASIFEEGGFPGFSEIFTPEGSHHEQFDQFGMFHASADLELDPPDTTGDTYDPIAYGAYLHANTDAGGLTTWLIEEVEWSGRPCNNDDRLGLCNGDSNRENNTVYLPRWNAWLQVLDFVTHYPGGVALTMGEVALAQGYDNAPTVSNPDQSDADRDGVGDVIEGVTLAAAEAHLSRNLPGSLSATLTNGSGAPLAAQPVRFTFDADGEGTGETFLGTTGADGRAAVEVVATRSVGAATFTVEWDGLRATAAASASASVRDRTTVLLDGSIPAAGQVTDAVTLGATLVDTDGAPIAGRALTFALHGATASAPTDAAGRATVTLMLPGPAAAAQLEVAFAGDALYASSATVAPFGVLREDTVLTLTNAVAVTGTPAVTTATLREADGAPLAGKVVVFLVGEVVSGSVSWSLLGIGLTEADGRTSLAVPSRLTPARHINLILAIFPQDDSFAGSASIAAAYRQ